MVSLSLELDDIHNAAIGKVATQWALLEKYIDVVIWDLVGSDPRDVACVTSQIGGVGRQIDAMTALYELNGAGKKTLKALNKFAVTSGEMSRKRNRIIHDIWGYEEQTGELYRFEITAQKRLVMDPHPVPLSDLAKVADDIRNHRGHLRKITEEIYAEMFPSRKTPLGPFLLPTHPQSA